MLKEDAGHAGVEHLSRTERGGWKGGHQLEKRLSLSALAAVGYAVEAAVEVVAVVADGAVDDAVADVGASYARMRLDLEVLVL